jgi:hypothetical protein
LSGSPRAAKALGVLGAKLADEGQVAPDLHPLLDGRQIRGRKTLDDEVVIEAVWGRADAVGCPKQLEDRREECAVLWR